MTENELKSLKDLPVPEPRPAARAAALAAALAAFDQGAAHAEEKSDERVQGNGKPVRLTPPSTRSEGGSWMRTRYFTYKIAASLAVLAIGAPVAFFMAQKGAERPTAIPAPANTEAPATAEAPAKARHGTRPRADKSIYDRLTVEAGEPQSKPSLPQDAGTGGGMSIDDRIAKAFEAAKRRPQESAPGFGEGAPRPVSTFRVYPDGKADEPPAQQRVAAAPVPAPAPQPPAPSAPTVQPQKPDASDSYIVDKQTAPSRFGMRGEGPVAPPAVKVDGPPVSGGASQEAKRRQELKWTGIYDGLAPNDLLDETQSAPLSAPVSGMRRETGEVQAPSAGKQTQPAPKPQSVAQAPAASAPASGQPMGPEPSAQPGDDRRFESVDPNPVRQAASDPVSTFSLDVDTVSYSFVRRSLNEGKLPPPEAVRVEEMINYFPYDYPQPDGAGAPLQPTVTVTPAPWNPANRLIHIAIKGREIPLSRRPRANLVFLVDVSGSMSPPDRLPLLKNALRMLLNELAPDDSVAIVTFSTGSNVALPPTKVADKGKILAAIDGLWGGGSTAGSVGLDQAYRLAQLNFYPEAVNRVIMATDGDFNEGVTDREGLKRFIAGKRKSGVFLSIIGFGHDNYNDALMQTLAQNGNGQAVFVDNLNEARKVLIEQASSVLFTIAKDAKVQVEFNPAQVSEYRLIGYETRALKRRDFNNDKVDAGDVGSGHTVTAIYEVTPVGAPKSEDDLRYQKPDAKPAAEPSPGAELGFLKLRYKLPNEEASRLISLPITPAMEKPIEETSDDVRFSTAVAGFGQLLLDLPYLKNFGYDDVIALAQGARGADVSGHRAEFVNLARLARLAQPRRSAGSPRFYARMGARADSVQAETLLNETREKYGSLLGAYSLSIAPADPAAGETKRYVRMGPFPDGDSAVGFCEKLKREGLKTCVVVRDQDGAILPGR